MLPPGHVAGGFLVGKIVQYFFPQYSGSELLWWSAFFGFFPDLDFFLVFLKTKKFISNERINHRKFATHAPLPYLLLLVIWYLLIPKHQLVAVAFILGTWSHFLLDSFSLEGIAWLYPFSKKLYNKTLDTKIVIKKENFFEHWTEFLVKYSKLFSFKAELALISIALATLILNLQSLI